MATNSGMAANAWKTKLQGDVLDAGRMIAILGTLKMEVNVQTPDDAKGKKAKAFVKQPKIAVYVGNALLTIKQVEPSKCAKYGHLAG